MSTKKIRILGIDPGVATVGFGLIEAIGGKCGLLEYGVISTSKNQTVEKRLLEIFQKTESLLNKTKPHLTGIEDIFFYKNQKTAIGVGQARGVILMACAKNKRKIFSITPLQVKLSLTGYGRADKKQIKKMVEIELKTKNGIKPDDATDALATAISTYFICARKNAVS